jgi:hypothetical protein
MQIKITGLHTKYMTRSCEVTAELLDQTGPITKLVDRVSFTIHKPYDNINDAVAYEAALILSAAGYPVSVPDVLPEGLLPDQGDIPEPIQPVEQP